MHLEAADTDVLPLRIISGAAVGLSLNKQANIADLLVTNTATLGALTIGTQPGIAATVDVLVSAGTTNRMVFAAGVLVSNIANFHE